MIEISEISKMEHSAFLDSQPSASFLQLPEWGAVKPDWKAKSLGIYEENQLIGVALMLLRRLPKTSRYFAYVPEGPVLKSERIIDLQLLRALESYAKSTGAFLIRIGITTPLSDWESSTIKEALASEHETSLFKLCADQTYQSGAAAEFVLQSAGWRNVNSADGFGEGQPNFLFQLDLRNSDEESLLGGFNQLWRRNIKKAANEEVAIRQGRRDELPLFHVAYLETALRDRFMPRPLAYFEQMWDALNQNRERLLLFLAVWQGEVIASAIAIVVGDHYWYSYGASTEVGREARGSNAIQWAMMKDALARGCHTYDLRGITPTLDPKDSHAGLIQFKVGTGGYARQVVGEWEHEISRPLAALFRFALKINLKTKW